MLFNHPILPKCFSFSDISTCCNDTGDPLETSQHQRLVGRLIYLSYTRLDIAFVSLVSQFMHSPHEEYLEDIYRILRYLKSAPDIGLFLKKTGQQGIEMFSDVD